MNWLLVVGAGMLGFQVAEYLFAWLFKGTVTKTVPLIQNWITATSFALIAAWIAWTVNP